MDKQGNPREYSSAYLRRTYREGKRVRNETVANLSALPEQVVDWIDAGLKGEQLVPAGGEFTIARSLPHGHVAAVAAMAHRLGFPALLGPSCRARDLALALIISRVLRPASKLSTAAWWPDTTLGVDLGVADATTDEIYAAMDWLVDRQDGIESKLAAKHLGPAVNPERMALFDLSSSWVTGRCCELAARGYSRDGKKGCEQIEYGILTDPAGRPVAVRVFEGNTADPTAFTEIVPVIRDTFGLDKLVLVGDRGMITSARIAALRELNDDPDTATDFGWITALRAPHRQTGRRGWAAADEPVRHPRPGRDHPPRLPGRAADRLPQPATGRRTRPQTRRPAGRHREAAEPDHRPRRRRPALRCRRHRRRGRQGDRQIQGGQALSPQDHRHHPHRPTPTRPDRRRSRPRRHLRATHQRRRHQLDPAAVVIGYKNLANVERDFRIIKVDDLDLRPIHHRLDDRVRAHVLICMLACYLVWHLRKAWAPMTFTDEHPPQRDNPVAPAQRSQAPTPRPPTSTTPRATRCAASAACSTTWPPSPATRSATPAPTPKSPCSPNPPTTNAEPSTSSAPPSP